MAPAPLYKVTYQCLAKFFALLKFMFAILRQEIGPSHSSAVQEMEWFDSPINGAGEAELPESRTEEREIQGEVTSIQSEHVSERQDKERRREGADGADKAEGAEGAGREKEQREGGGSERKQFKA